MVRKEVTGFRPLDYSQWHRNHAPPTCYCTDLDMIEWRDGRGIVAVMEIKLNDACVTGFQLKVIKELAMKLQVRGFVVRYYPEVGKEGYFKVEEIWPNRSTKTMTSYEYQNLLKNL